MVQRMAKKVAAAAVLDGELHQYRLPDNADCFFSEAKSARPSSKAYSRGCLMAIHYIHRFIIGHVSTGK